MSTKPYPNKVLTDIAEQLLDVDGLTLEQIRCLALDLYGEAEAIMEDRNERAWEAYANLWQPDDSSYRRDMINAGRGHLLK